ncbi:MAG: UDP-N-acetylmuramoyl-L-alanyl-D-glutamate--2,6-diaminopimelate ligase [Planctomycetaceae bacterium]
MPATVQHHRPIPVSLRRLFPTASFIGCSDVIATDVVEDSRLASPGTVFAVIRGTQVDGARFVEDAVQQGSPAILTEQPVPGITVPQCIVSDTRLAYSKLCDAILGYPARRLKVCGVTGTNGKSTTAWLLQAILTAAGERCGLLGTIEYSDSFSTGPSTLTTPDSRLSAHWFRRMVDVGASAAVIELSSHALHQRRVAAIPLAAAIITNVTRDHFDYHGHFEDYLDAKSQVLSLVAPGGCIVINSDDAGCVRLIEPARQTGHQVITIGFNPDADLRAELLDESIDGSRFRIAFRSEAVRQSLSGAAGSRRDGASQPVMVRSASQQAQQPSPIPLFEVSTSLPARHNVMNCLAATVVALHLGASPESIARGIEQTRSVPGRLERIDLGQPFHVFVDYAHTDDALRRVVDNLNSLTSGRVICLFGAGGERDCTKRPLLAEAASHADVAVVTSDNPRTESSTQIIEDILAGFPDGYSGFHIEPDRRRAIAHAFSLAEPDDCVLIAGKGHESSQIIGQERHPFDDRQVAAELLRELPSVRTGAPDSLMEADQ